MEKGGWVELLVLAWADGIEDPGVCEPGEARETPIQIESRVRGSDPIVESRESAQPVAAPGWLARIATASAPWVNTGRC
jgi:hypothetical protein